MLVLVRLKVSFTASTLQVRLIHETCKGQVRACIARNGAKASLIGDYFMLSFQAQEGAEECMRVGKIPSAAKQAAEKVPSETESVPQGLKPHCKQNTCGTAKAVLLSETGFFRRL
jgi:hypothetical protein